MRVDEIDLIGNFLIRGQLGGSSQGIGYSGSSIEWITVTGSGGGSNGPQGITGPNVTGSGYKADSNQIVFSDGNLLPNEVRNLKTNAELVSLVTCESSAGKLIHGDGVKGMTEALTTIPPAPTMRIVDTSIGKAIPAIDIADNIGYRRSAISNIIKNNETFFKGFTVYILNFNSNHIALLTEMVNRIEIGELAMRKLISNTFARCVCIRVENAVGKIIVDSALYKHTAQLATAQYTYSKSVTIKHGTKLRKRADAG
jgi:hypothetical protein